MDELNSFANSAADRVVTEGGATIAYVFGINDCDSIYLPKQFCGNYDCIGKDYAGFFNQTVGDLLVQEKNASGSWDDPIQS